jgi:hypothetical protein
MRKKEMRDALIEYIAEMHKFINVPYDEDACKKEDWFMRHTWTSEEEDKFKEWLITEIRKDFEFSKKISENEANFFLLNYGWKTNNGI